MSNFDSPYIENDHLRKIIENSAHYRDQASQLLWSIPKEKREAKDLQCLIKFVPSLAEQAAEELVRLEKIYPSDLDPIFDHITSRSLRISAGETILAMEQDRYRYAKVVREVPELREKALAMLLEAGPLDHWGLHAIWVYADPSVRSAQWDKYCRAGRPAYELLPVISANLYLDLVLLAFALIHRVWVWENSSAYDYQLHVLLECPPIQQQAWDWMVGEDKMTIALALEVMTEDHALREKAWEWLKLDKKADGWPLSLVQLNLATDKNRPAWLREFAAREALAIADTPFKISALLHIPYVKDLAAERLLKEYQLEPTES